MIRKAAIINATNVPARRWPRLAGLPLLLRMVLTAQRAGLEEIIIVGGKNPNLLLKRNRRVTLRWRWIPGETADGCDGEMSLLGRLRNELNGNFVLFFTDSIFDTSALQSLCQTPLNGQAARTAVAEGEASNTGLYLCSPEFMDLARTNGTGERIDSFAETLRQQGQLDNINITGRLWGRASNPARLRDIERELTHFHLKPSDGNFARFNKLVLAEPLIRFFVRTPITPNFITFLGLLFAMAGGLACAQGGYGWILAGALLNFFSALLDHVDGMVARLKFQESAFGTWFETAVDYSSYLFFFSGLSVGLYRETGETYNLVFGGLFLFATIVSFILQGWQRNRMSPENPTDYINRLHRSLDQNRDDFSHWFSRNLYFIVRRAVLPYFIVLLCVLKMSELLLGWTAIGANLFWLLLLNSNRTLPAADSEGD